MITLMNNTKLITISIIVIFFVTIGLLASIGEYTNFINDDGFDDINGKNNTTVIIEFYVSAVECTPCDEAKQVIAEDIEPFYSDETTIKKYAVSYSEENKENLEKWRSYGFKSVSYTHLTLPTN